MWTLISNIVGPIIGLIFKGIDKSAKKKKTYNSDVDEFQDIEQNSISDEQEAIDFFSK